MNTYLIEMENYSDDLTLLEKAAIHYTQSGLIATPSISESAKVYNLPAGALKKHLKFNNII
mgnify:CR=1 FL=1